MMADVKPMENSTSVEDVRPTAAELIDALNEYLDAEIKPRLKREDAYQLRVASNLLEIVRRELELGEGHRARELQGLAELLGQNGLLHELNGALCEFIRAGKLTAAHPKLMHHLRSSVMDRLSVSNPRYSAYLRARLNPGSEDDRAGSG